MVGQVEGAEVEGEEQQGGEKHEAATEYSAGDVGDDAGESESECDGPGRYHPGVNTEEVESCSVEEVGARGDEFEKVAIENLAVKDSYSAREEESLVACADKGSGGKQDGSQVKERKCAGKRKGEGGAREAVRYLRWIGFRHEWTIVGNNAMDNPRRQIAGYNRRRDSKRNGVDSCWNS